jgi:hypothetical protein
MVEVTGIVIHFLIGGPFSLLVSADADGPFFGMTGGIKWSAFGLPFAPKKLF